MDEALRDFISTAFPAGMMFGLIMTVTNLLSSLVFRTVEAATPNDPNN
jgi:hypothetical protein